MADDFGFQPTQATEDLGFQPTLPNVPDLSGVVKTAQKNLSTAEQEKAFQDIVSKPIQAPEEKLNTAAGFPVDKVLSGSAKPQDFDRQCRAQYVGAIKNGSAVNSSDWMQTLVPTVAGVALNRVANFDYSGAGENLAGSAVRGLINNPNPLEAVGRTLEKIPGQIGEAISQSGRGLAGRLVAPFVSEEARSDLRRAGDLATYPVAEQIKARGGPITTEDRKRLFAEGVMQSPVGPYSGLIFSPFAPLSPAFEGAEKTAVAGGVGQGDIDLLNAGLAVSSLALHPAAKSETSFPPGTGPWANPPAALKEKVGQIIGKSPDAVTPQDIDTVVATGSKDIHPSARDFKSVAVVSGLPETTLHTVYVETGVRPDQVLEDAQRDPAVASDVAEGKVPEAYEHLVEPPVFDPEESVKLNVVKSETGTGFSVVDADGEHVQSGFDSAQEAKHYIEDKQFETEERAAIEAEKETPAAAKPEITIDETPQGEQTVLPGAEKISDKNLAERLMDKLKGSAKEQKPANEGLFDTGAQKQTDLLDPNMVTHEVKIREPAKPEAKLPKELSGAKPRYGYGSKQFTLKFESDIDRAAYTVSGKGESKAHAKYEKFLKDNGFDAAAIAELGAKVRDAVKAIAKDAEAGELTIKSSRGEAPRVEKAKPQGAIPPSKVGKPTSLSTFIKNNGKIKPETHDAGDLESQGHKDLLSPSGKPADTMREMAEQAGYIKPGMSVAEFHDLLNDTDGGRSHFREIDSDRVSASLERALEADRNDPTRIEHEADRVGIDTKKLEGETEKQWLNRLKNSLSDFYRNSEGFGRVRSEAGKWLLEKPIQTVEKWAGKLTGGIFQKIAEGYIKTFQPELMGDKALRLDSQLAKFKVAQEEARNTYFRQWRNEIKAWDKTTSDERMAWLYDHETGRWNPENNPDHAIEQAMYDAMYEAEQKAGVGSENFKENYLPHQWEKPDEVVAYFKSDALIKKFGKDWFTKASVFDLIQEGVRAGFKLKTDNPARMRVARQLASDNMLRTMDLLKDMEGSGIATPTKTFSIDKRIAKTERQIAELQEKYKKEFEDAEKQKSLTDKDGKPIGEPASKKVQLAQKRLDALHERLADFNAEKSANKLTPEQMKDLKNGFKVIGPDNKAWSISQEGAPLWKNVMDSKGLWEREGVLGDAYRTYMGAKNTWIAAKLAASLFHIAHVAQIDLAGSISTAAHHLIQGGKISDLMTKESLPHLGITGETFKAKDHPAIQAWNTPKEARTPEQQYLVTKMVEGGFKPTLSIQDMVRVKDNFDKAVAGLGANNLRLIGTALQIPGMAMKPFMEHWIPGMKAEIYDRATELALARDPSLKTDAGKRGEVFRQISKDIEHTYGEMNQGTLFWNKTIKDAFNASYISGGWKLAQLYNLKGLLEPLQVAGKYLKTGEFNKADITYRMINAYTYTALTLATGAMVAKILGQPIMQAGDDVWDIVKNLIAPKTGDKNPDGSPIRVNQPAFAKEGYMLARDINQHGLTGGIGAFIYNGTLIPGVMETLSVAGGGLSDLVTGENRPIGKDELGRTVIKDPTNLHEWMNVGWDAIAPITMTTAARAEAKGSETAKTLGWLGFPMAGAYLDQTPFEQQVISKYFERNPSDSSIYESKLKAEMKGAVVNHNSEEENKIEAKMKDIDMSAGDIAKSKRIYTDKFSEYAWSKLSSSDQKILIDSASDEEKSNFAVKTQ